MGLRRFRAAIWPRSRVAMTLAAVLLIHSLLVIRGAAIHSPAWDEVGHLAAGISHWRSGRFDLYRVNPPLVRLLATLPAVVAGADIAWERYDAAPWSRTEGPIGHQFLRTHGPKALRVFTIARWSCLPLSLLGALTCYFWGSEAFGDRAGLAAAVLWCSSPTVLGNAEMITPDVGAAAVGAAACYAFWRWLRRPVLGRAGLAGLLLGLALLTKFTWVLLPPLWGLLWLVEVGTARLRRPLRSARQAPAHLALMLAMAWQVVTLGYLFEGLFTPIGELPFISRTLAPSSETNPFPTRNRFTGTWLGRLPMPLPANYVLGIDVQRSDFEKRYWSYLRGQWKRGGWWYYYLYALLVKEPVGTLGLALLATLLAVGDRRRFGVGLRDVSIVAPAAAVMLLVSSQTGFNHHLRYVLPALPFFYIWMARVFGDVEIGPAPRPARVLSVALLMASVASSLWHVPHSLSYFNELAGGPLNGHRHLHHSNIEWGQDLLLLKRWMDAHPEARPMQIVFANAYSSAALGIWDDRTTHAKAPDPRPSRAGSPRWYAITTRALHDRAEPGAVDRFARFRGRKPSAVVGYSIAIFEDR